MKWGYHLNVHVSGCFIVNFHCCENFISHPKFEVECFFFAWVLHLFEITWFCGRLYNIWGQHSFHIHYKVLLSHYLSQRSMNFSNYFLWVCGVGRENEWVRGNKIQLIQYGVILQSIQTSSRTHPASLFNGCWGSLPGVQWLGYIVAHSPPSSAEVRNEWRLYICSPYIPSWCGQGQLYHRG